MPSPRKVSTLRRSSTNVNASAERPESRINKADSILKGNTMPENKRAFLPVVKQEHRPTQYIVESQTNRSGNRKRKAADTETETVVSGESPIVAKRKSVNRSKRITTRVKEMSDDDNVSSKKANEKTALKEGQLASSDKGTSTKSQKKEIGTQQEQIETEGKQKFKRKTKTREEKDAEAIPLAARTTGLRMFIVTNALHIGGNAFAMFLKSQRKWDNPPLQGEIRDQFKAHCGQHDYDASSHVLPHGSYLVNLAQEDPEKARQAYDAFLDDLNRCDALGIKLYNFHPGSTGSASRPSAIGRIASALNRAHSATTAVIPVLEAMAGAGNVIGSTFEDLRDIIALVDDKSRIGVCIDTCHVFAAGYDLRSPKAFAETLESFNRIVGMKYLSALHLNDSKAPLASHRDLHQNIGLGFLGLRAFHNIMNDKRFEDLPLVLETPINTRDESGKDVEDKSVWAREIKLLEGLIGMDPSSGEFKRLEMDLSIKGAEDRAKYADAFERKKAKVKATEKGQTKLGFAKKKKQKVMADGDVSE